MKLEKKMCVLVIGSGPIRIGQGCEFDYSCTQACRALREEGIRVVLINPNPATIMTDSETADAVYIEPLDTGIVHAIIKSEQVTHVLATMGGQAGLNLGLELDEKGILAETGAELLGVDPQTIRMAEDRQLFKNMLKDLDLGFIAGCVVDANNVDDLPKLIKDMQYPLIIRASFTLGGGGGGIVHNWEDLVTGVRAALEAGHGHSVTIEESITGWKEYELEVMTDSKKTFLVVATVENINPMGVHTGDSVTVVPAITLRDHEFQNMRDAAKRIFSALGMRIGGANIQFAIHPKTGRMVIVEMNPRVSRSSALVSKATGYPIAHISAKLAVGYDLDNITNGITQGTSSALEPVIDYVAVKIPRFDSDKFAPGDRLLGISMKSVGEALAFGSTFAEAFTKAWRSLECGFDCQPNLADWEKAFPRTSLAENESEPADHSSWRLAASFAAIKTDLQNGTSCTELHARFGVSTFFLEEMRVLVEAEQAIQRERAGASAHSTTTADPGSAHPDTSPACTLWAAGYPTRWFERHNCIAQLNATEKRKAYRLVDSCAGEFAARSPYYFSTAVTPMADENRIDTSKERVVILGSGPNRVGQGIEFDYACVHAVRAVKAAGKAAIMVNCNPETVSTDSVEADKLYVEPIDADGVLSILAAEKPCGVIVQFGGQSPLKIAQLIEDSGFKLLGTQSTDIWRAEDRPAFEALLSELNLKSPPTETFDNRIDLLEAASRFCYPVLMRPSFVIGGQGMLIVAGPDQMRTAVVSVVEISPEYPILVQKFLTHGTEYDLDMLVDGDHVEIIGGLRHLDPPGIHSGDSICEWIPPDELAPELSTAATALARGLNAYGLVNVQLVQEQEQIFIIEANPRCSRTVPFLAKLGQSDIIGRATRIALGLTEPTWENASKTTPTNNLTRAQREHLNQRETDRPKRDIFAYKFPVFPYEKFAAPSYGPGPEMHSLGEVMGRSNLRTEAFLKGATAAGWHFPAAGRLSILVDSESAAERFASALEELQWTAVSAGLSFNTMVLAEATDRVARRNLFSNSNLILLPQYTRMCAGNMVPEQAGLVAQAIGRKTPVALNEECCQLAITATCLSITMHAEQRPFTLAPVIQNELERNKFNSTN
jgi:carbamoyl-phosphate synthase large subunit